MAEADMIETEIKRLLAEEVAAVEAPARSKKLRDRAEECRALAQIVTSAPNVASYLNLAQIYDGLAEQQEQLARDIVSSTSKRPVSGLGSRTTKHAECSSTEPGRREAAL